jgi:hypothetical protein
MVVLGDDSVRFLPNNFTILELHDAFIDEEDRDDPVIGSLFDSRDVNILLEQLRIESIQ